MRRNLSDILGIIEYQALVLIPGYATKLLWQYDHKVLAVLIFLFGCYTFLLRMTDGK